MPVNLGHISISKQPFDNRGGGGGGGVVGVGIGVGLFQKKIICFLNCIEKTVADSVKNIFYLVFRECFIKLYCQRKIKM